jgi:hypothetical protein
MIYRILDPTDAEDTDKFFNLMNHYINSDSRLFNKESNIIKSNLYKTLFNTLPKKDFIVSGKFENNCLNKILICQTLDSKYNRENLLPFYVFDFFYSIEKNWNLKNAEELNQLNTIGASHFWSQGYTKGYQFTRLPAHILNSENLEFEINGYLLRTYSSEKLQPQLEQIFLTQKDLDEYKFKILKCMFPTSISKPFMLVSWSLKPEFILDQQISCK